MATDLRPIRRVVTTNDERGRSKILFDGPAPNAHQASMGVGRGHTNLWVWNDALPTISGEVDAGNMPYDFPGPPDGGHLRVVQSIGRPTNYDPANDPDVVPMHPPKLRPPSRTWDRGGNNAYSSSMHKTETVDYGIQLFGERVCVLDDAEVSIRPGDIIVQVGAYHQWTSPREGGIMLFDMIAARFLDGEQGLAQGNDRPLPVSAEMRLPSGVRPARRIVTIDRERNRSSLVSDGRCADVVVLEVANGGTIDPDLLPQLFDPFRGREPSAGRQQGLGLGLFIAHQIVLAHGGDIDVRSQAGVTRFRVTLPRVAPGAAAAQAA